MKYLKLYEEYDGENNNSSNSLKDKMVGINPDKLSPGNKEKYDLVTYIKDFVKRYGKYIRIGALVAGENPFVDDTNEGYHLIEVLTIDSATVVVWGGYDNQENVNEYEINYFDLDIEILKEIKEILDNAIENKLLEYE